MTLRLLLLVPIVLILTALPVLTLILLVMTYQKVARLERYFIQRND